MGRSFSRRPAPRRPLSLLRGGPAPAAPWPAWAHDGAAGAGAGTPQLEALGFLGMGLFGVVGFTRGARREWLPLLVALCATIGINNHWAAVVRALHSVQRLLVLVLKERGSPAQDQAAAWSTASASAGMIPSDQGAAVWQIGLFAASVLAGYLLSQRIGRSQVAGMVTLARLPDLVDRLVGAVLGAATGYVAGTFVLARLFPAAGLDLTGAQSFAHGYMDRLGAPGFFALVALFILFGVLGLGSRGKQVFGS
jgi:hypothetical protein